MANENNNSLFKISDSLCFDKDEFLQDTFCVDKFVSEHRKQTSLETLRDDLGAYLRVLRSAMIELINKDYADFVHLSTNLVGLDKAIGNLFIPLGQLREEILSVKTAVGEVLEKANVKLEHKKTIQRNKILLQRNAFIVEDVERIEKWLGVTPEELKSENMREVKKDWTGNVIERVAIEISQVNFHINKLPNLPIVQKIKPRVSILKNVVQSHLEESFISAIDSGDKEILKRILFINTAIDQVDKLEKFYREQIVKPYMRDTITEKSMDLNGIGFVFDKVLLFIPSKCSILLEVTRGYASAPGVSGYNFLTNSVWQEIVDCLESFTPYIFSPGNPDLFQQRYTESMKFLDKFEAFYSSKEDVMSLRQSTKYKLFLEKWNIEIYFRIRFQHIAGQLENAIVNVPFQNPPGEAFFLLQITNSLWECVEQCWSDKTYISPLTHKFWKLTLQLISRFCNWAEQQLPECETPNRSREESPNLEGSAASDNVESKMQAETNVLNVVKLVADVHTLENVLPDLFKNIIEPKMTLIGMRDTECLKSGLDESILALQELIPLAGRTIVKDVTSCAAQMLKLVGDIPRLYRKTNREIPSKPSSYVNAVTETLEKFVLGDQAISSVWKQEWTKSVLESISEQYLSVTGEVLMSVKKMEDSLKRLKRSRDKNAMGSTVSQGTGMTDDDKIRLQLWLDVEQFGKAIESLGVSKDDIEGYGNLVELVSSARSSPSSNA